MLRKIIVLTALAVMAVGLSGCDNNLPQQNRSVVTVASVNEGEITFTSDVYYYDGTAGGIFPDYVPVVFRNRPYNRMIITDDGEAYGSYQITRYTIEWESTDGSGTVLPNYTADIFVEIPTDEEAAANVMIVTWQDKATPPLSNIVAPNFAQISMNAKITFYGHEAGTDRETAVNCNLGVIFIDLNNEATP
jgi:hypothetical protein